MRSPDFLIFLILNNPLTVQDPAPALPVEARESGGLGILMVRRLASDLSYVYDDICNVLTVKIKIDNQK